MDIVYFFGQESYVVKLFVFRIQNLEFGQGLQYSGLVSYFFYVWVRMLEFFQWVIGGNVGCMLRVRVSVISVVYGCF